MPTWISDDEYKETISDSRHLKTSLFVSQAENFTQMASMQDLGYPQMDPKFRDREPLD